MFIMYTRYVYYTVCQTVDVHMSIRICIVFFFLKYKVPCILIALHGRTQLGGNILNLDREC